MSPRPRRATAGRCVISNAQPGGPTRAGRCRRASSRSAGPARTGRSSSGDSRRPGGRGCRRGPSDRASRRPSSSGSGRSGSRSALIRRCAAVRSSRNNRSTGWGNLGRRGLRGVEAEPAVLGVELLGELPRPALGRPAARAAAACAGCSRPGAACARPRSRRSAVFSIAARWSRPGLGHGRDDRRETPAIPRGRAAENTSRRRTGGRRASGTSTSASRRGRAPEARPCRSGRRRDAPRDRP